MRMSRWFVVLTILLASASLSLATGLGGKGDGKSTVLTNYETDITPYLQACGPEASTEVQADCSSLGANTQEIFTGVNGLGMPAQTLSLTLTFGDFTNVTSFQLSCTFANIFTVNNCNNSGGGLTITPGETVTITFSQGTGLGLGCYDQNPSDPAAQYNGACQAYNNSVVPGSGNAYQSGIQTTGNSCTNPYNIPNLVCGPDEFVVGFGADVIVNGVNIGGPLPDLPLDVVVTLIPEPSSLVLLFAGLLVLVFVGRFRRDQVAIS